MGRPPTIDRARVLNEALALADERGLEALTMAGLAQRLGVTPMALYRHVADKADLLDGLVELLLGETAQPSPGLAWRERLDDIARSIRASARRHPSVFPLLLRRSASTVEARRTRLAVYSALAEAGVAGDRVEQVERLLSTAVLGFAVSEAAGRFRGRTRREIDADFELLEDMLGQFISSCASKEIA